MGVKWAICAAYEAYELKPKLAVHSLNEASDTLTSSREHAEEEEEGNSALKNAEQFSLHMRD